MRVNQPVELKVKLYDHQLISIKKMENMEEQRRVIKKDWVKEFKLGINADPTGYGKTLTTIGLLLRDKMEWDIDLPYINTKVKTQSNLIKTNIINRYIKINCNLILVSSSIINQWKKELSYSNLNFFCVNTKKKLESLDIENLDVLIITPSLYNYLVQMYSKYAWKRFIFDEPANIRVSNMKEIQAGFYWFITATPYGIWQKHHKCSNSFIKNIIGDDFFNFKEEIKDIIVKNDMETIMKSFQMPDLIKFTYNCFQPILNAVKNLVSPAIERMLEGNDIDGVISILGGVKTDNVLELLKQNKLKQIEEIKVKKKLHRLKNNLKMIEHLEKKEELLLNETKELDKRFKTFKENTCSICLNKPNNPVIEVNCKNVFCSKCLLTWLNKNKHCPLCRKNIKVENLIYISSEKKSSNIIKTKEDTIIDIITKQKNGKFLIFSDFNASFNLIENVLRKNKIEYTQLKGTANTRNLNINKYKNGEIDVILLNSKYDGSGINLQETTDIIFYHKMSKYSETQIIGRAQRIGRKDILHLHYLNS